MTVTVLGKPKLETIEVTGIHLFKVGGHVVVNAEIEGTWVEVIRERADGGFSHIVETDGMRKAVREALGIER